VIGVYQTQAAHHKAVVRIRAIVEGFMLNNYASSWLA